MATLPVARGTSASVCHPHVRQAAERAGWRRSSAHASKNAAESRAFICHGKEESHRLLLGELL